MARLDGCTETVAPDELTASEVIEVFAALLTRLDLVVTRSDYGRGVRINLVTKTEVEARRADYEEEWTR